MLSTLVLLADSDGPPASIGALVRTLGSLVPGTIEGLVRDVAIVTTGTDPEVERVADHAGCALVGGVSFAQAVERAMAGARSPLLLLLRAGAYVDRDFRDEVARTLVDLPTPEPLLLRQAPSSFLGRVVPDLAPVAGLIARADGLRPAGSFDAMVRGAGRGRTLAARSVTVA